MKQTSPNGSYEFEVSSGVIEDQESVEDGVIMHRIDDRVELYENGRLQFEKDLRAPEKGDVADNGVCTVIEGKNWDKPEAHWEGDDKYDTIYVFDKSGATLLKQQFEGRNEITDCAVDGSGQNVAVVGPSAGNLLIYNTETGQEVTNQSVPQIDYPHEIERVRWNGAWCFKLTDPSELKAVVLDTSGEVVETDMSVKSLYEKTEEQKKNKDTIAGTLEDSGLEVPNAVYFVCALTADQTPSADSSRLRSESDYGQGLFDPDWSEFVFFHYEELGLTYVIGPENNDEAISALSDFASIERVDLPSEDTLENSVEELSLTDPPDEMLSMGNSGLSVSLSDESMIRSIAYDRFFGNYEEPSQLSVDGDFDSRFPDTETGELLEKIYEKKESLLDIKELQRVTADQPEEVIESYPLILELVEGGAFQPYTIDSRSSRPFVNQIIEPVAESNPELVLSNLDRACDLMKIEQSVTAAEVMCHHLQDLVKHNPDCFEELSSVVQSLLESEHAHPQRRAYDILRTALRVQDQQTVENSVFGESELVSKTCETITTTNSVWLQRSCCETLSRYDLSESDYETIAGTTDALIDLFQVGGDQRGNLINRGFGDILYGVHTEEELRELLSKIDISDEAAYRCSRAAGNVLRIVAANRAEAVLPYFETIWEDFTADGDSMEVVRRDSFYILSDLVDAEPSSLAELLDRHTSEIIQLLNHEEDNRVRFAIDCLEIIDSAESVDALHRIHLDESHEHWQRATNALEQIAPKKIDTNIEPENEQQAWIDFVTELAEKQGQLPRAKDVIREPTKPGEDRWKHPDAPNSEYWEVFEDSWDGVLASLDLETEYRSSGAPLRERLIQGLQATAKVIDGVPTGADFERETGYTTYNLKKEFGGIKAARRAAGVDRDSTSETTEQEDASASSESNPKNTTPTRSQLTEAIVELAESVEDTPTTTQMNNQGAFPMSAYYAEFDTWNEALEASGITPTRSDRSTGTTRDDLRAELRRLGDELGRTPKTTDVKSESEFSLGRYYNEYNSWSEALSDAGFSG